MTRNDYIKKATFSSLFQLMGRENCRFKVGQDSDRSGTSTKVTPKDNRSPNSGNALEIFSYPLAEKGEGAQTNT